MPNKYIDVRINEERFCTEGIAEFSLLNMDALNEDGYVVRWNAIQQIGRFFEENIFSTKDYQTARGEKEPDLQEAKRLRKAVEDAFEKYNRTHENIERSVPSRIRMDGDPLCPGVARLPGGRDVERLLLPAQPFRSADAESGTERKGWYGMTITIYPDGHSIQQGTPEELARLAFEMQALQTLQSFRNMVEAIQAEMEKQQKQKEVAATIPEAPKKRPPKRKAKTDGKT